ncbi:MAG TPA: dihydroorotate dehydrogenase electron transfer subunit [Polyangiaceae bacterium]
MSEPPVAAVNPPEIQKPKFVSLPLAGRESFGASYHVLTFDHPEGSGALPGQFAMVRGAEWGESPLLPRPMSYLSGGDSPSILIKVLGEGTARMARAEPGERYFLLGPLGRPWRPPTPGRRPLLVGGGVGIAPLLFFCRWLVERGFSPLSLYGGRSEHDLPLSRELSKISDLQVTTEDGSGGARGRVTDVLEKLLQPDMEVYTCGPHRMMALVADICDRHDIVCEASLETPMACGYGVCLGCAVPTTEGRFLYACVEGPCVDARRVDWRPGAGAFDRAEDAACPSA